MKRYLVIFFLLAMVLQAQTIKQSQVKDLPDSLLNKLTKAEGMALIGDSLSRIDDSLLNKYTKAQTRTLIGDSLSRIDDSLLNKYTKAQTRALIGDSLGRIDDSLLNKYTKEQTRTLVSDSLSRIDDSLANKYTKSEANALFQSAATYLIPSDSTYIHDQLILKAPLLSPSFTTPSLDVATGTSLALNGATLSSYKFAMTGNAYIDGGLTMTYDNQLSIASLAIKQSTITLNTFGGNLTFSTRQSGGTYNTNQIYLAPTGNVGILTATPDSTFTVTGSGDFSTYLRVGNKINAIGGYLLNGVPLAKGDVGLGNVDNTSDANKPVSTAQQTALDAKVAYTDTSTVLVTKRSSQTISGAKHFKTITADNVFQLRDETITSLQFNGTNQYASLSNTTALNMGSATSFSIETLVRLDTLNGNWQFIVNKDDDGSTGILIAVNNLNQFLLRIRDASTYKDVSTTIYTKRFYHVVATINRTSNLMKLYINGDSVGVNDISTIGSIDISYPFAIAKSSHGSYFYFKGKVALVKVFTKALTSAEVATRFNYGNPQDYTDGDANIALYLKPSSIDTTSHLWTDVSTNNYTVNLYNYPTLSTKTSNDYGETGATTTIRGDTIKILSANITTTKFSSDRIAFFGDSFTEAGKYQPVVERILNCWDAYNNYQGGRSLAKNSTDTNNTFTKHLSDADFITFDPTIILIIGGYNDYNYDVPLGSLGDATSSTLYGAMKLIFDTLTLRYPTAKIFFATQTNSPYGENNANGLGLHTSDYITVIKAMCEKYSIPIIDLFTTSGMTNANKSTYFQVDEIHPTDAGYIRIGNIIGNYIYRF